MQEIKEENKQDPPSENTPKKTFFQLLHMVENDLQFPL